MAPISFPWLSARGGFLRSAAALLMLGPLMAAAPAAVPTEVDTARSQPSTDSAEPVARWVQDLADARFSTRRAASMRLVEAGQEAIEPVAAAAAAGSDREVIERSIEVLATLSYSAHRETALAAKRALEGLSGAGGQAAAKARSALHQRDVHFASQLGAVGGRVTFEGQRIATIFFDGTSARRGQLAPLRELTHVELVSLSDTDYGDYDLQFVKEIARVKKLRLARCQVTDEGLKHVAKIGSLEWLLLDDTKVTDAGLANLAGLKRLEYLSLSGCGISDAGLAHLADLADIGTLYLARTQVTDAGLVHLRRMNKLSHLRLDKTAISDAGVEQLASLKSLIRLELHKTKMSEQGIHRLQQALPLCRVVVERNPDDENDP